MIGLKKHTKERPQAILAIGFNSIGWQIYNFKNGNIGPKIIKNISNVSSVLGLVSDRSGNFLFFQSANTAGGVYRLCGINRLQQYNVPVSASASAVITGSPTSGAFSPDSAYFALSGIASPFIAVRPLDITNQGPTALGSSVSNPGTLPASFGISPAWSPDGAYVGVAHTSSPFVSVYPFNGAFGTKVSNPGTLPAGNGNCLEWNPAGTFVAIGNATSTPFIQVYAWSAGFGAKISNPATLPQGSVTQCHWSPDGNYLACTGAISPYLNVYSFDGTTLTKIADPPLLHAGTCTASAWSPDGKYLATCSNSATSGIIVYEFCNGNWGKCSQRLDATASGASSGICWLTV